MFFVVEEGTALLPLMFSLIKEHGFNWAKNLLASWLSCDEFDFSFIKLGDLLTADTPEEGLFIFATN